MPHFQLSASIPKNLYQIYRDENVPGDLARCMNRLASDNPEWQHTLVTDTSAEKFVKDHYGRAVLKLYLRINPDYGPARADLIRYLLLYRFGGVYMDIKSHGVLNGVIHPNDQFLVSQWPNKDFAHWGEHDELQAITGGEYQQWCLASVAGHPFLRAVICRVLWNISAYNPFLHGTGKKGVLRVTGPITPATWPPSASVCRN
ncbi:MAG: hypothetical protein JZU65_06735 [Chlorobium sp.]|nr:hypothetical protein [Chlorobium sp.]